MCRAQLGRHHEERLAAKPAAMKPRRTSALDSQPSRIGAVAPNENDARNPHLSLAFASTTAAFSGPAPSCASAGSAFPFPPIRMCSATESDHPA
eukprot:scaffold18456_cov124-Isochrysis_galbana.AAC.3